MRKPRRNPPSHTVVRTDEAAAVVLGGLPYGHQDAIIDDGSAPAASLTADGNGWSWESSTGVRGRLGGDRVAIDPAGVTQVPRPMPPPDTWLTVVAGSARRAGSPGVIAVDASTDLSSVVEQARDHRLAVVDVASFDPMTAAALVVTLAASGVVCAIEGDRALPGVDPRLVDALRIDRAEVAADEVVWAASLARQTRTAWLGHDLRLRWPRGDRAAPELAPAPVPPTTVLLASMRPDHIPMALRQIAAQETVRPEVVIAVHTADAAAVEPAETALRDFGLAGSVMGCSPDIPLGAVLNLAAERASGSLVVKWDDDDLYGPHHLEDLLVAWRTSGADLVGKRAEFVHFPETGETIVRGMEGAGTMKSMVIAGATLLTSRDRLMAAGGFAPLHRAVDWHLRKRYRRLGLRVFRTHGFGFVMVRRTDGHTWPVSREDLVRSAVRRWDGIPAIADVG